MESIKDIKKYKLFDQCDETEVAAMLRCFNAKFKSVEKGITFIHKGDKISYLYLVINGIARSEISDDDGNHTTNMEFRENDIIGINTFLSNNKYYPEDAFAYTDIELLVIDGFRLLNPCDNFCPRHTKVLRNIINILTKQNCSYESRIKQLTMHGTKEKIMAYLENYSETVGSKDFTIPYTQKDLAKYLGVERSAMSYELSKLASSGIIKYKGKHYTIL